MGKWVNYSCWQLTEQKQCVVHWGLPYEHLQSQGRHFAATLDHFATYFCAWNKRWAGRPKIFSLDVHPLYRTWQDDIGCKAGSTHSQPDSIPNLYVPLQQPHLGYVFNFPRFFGKQDLFWLIDLPKWWRPQLQQHNIMQANAHTLHRHSFGIPLGECTSSWQESFTVEEILKHFLLFH